MGRHIAITGASGFVGRALVRHASSLGWETVGLVRSREATSVVAAAGGRPVHVRGLNAGPLARAFAGAEAVVHLAQIGSEQAGVTYEAVNVGGTRNVINAAREAGVPRVVLFSGLGVAHYGMTRRCTNPYFLSKLTAELELFRSDRKAVVLRPSYIIGPGDGLVTALLRDMEAGEVERPGDGTYRLQPVAVADAAASVAAAVEAPLPAGTLVLDLVGPEAVAYDAFVHRLAAAARSNGDLRNFQVRAVPVEEAEKQAAGGGYRGMLRDSLDCLLCDEVSDPRPLEALLGHPLTSLDDALVAAVRAARDQPPLPG
jgi:nucleoside-diphosphate-sugar epimerase